MTVSLKIISCSLKVKARHYLVKSSLFTAKEIHNRHIQMERHCLIKRKSLLFVTRYEKKLLQNTKVSQKFCNIFGNVRDPGSIQNWWIKVFVGQPTLKYPYPVSWGCRMQPQHLCRGVRPSPNECPGYDTKQFDGEVPVMLELWGMQSTPLLPSLPGPL